ncbi:MAG: RodZ domain-containing protein [Candidatus Korobacteraceae bacterium]
MIRLAIPSKLKWGRFTNEVEAVGAFGERLRREREMRGISLEEIVATTKIGTRLLRALENEQFDLLPGGIFNKSYVRAYAKCVGIDEDEAVAAYLEAAQETPPDNRVIAHQASFHSDRIPERRGFPIVPVLILLVVIAGGVGGWKAYQDRQRDRAVVASSDATATQSPVAAPTANSSAPQTPGASQAVQSPPPTSANNSQRTAQPASNSAETPAPGTTATAAGATSADSAEGTFEVVIRPTDRAWVSVKSDGKFVVRGIIKPPDVKTIRATGQVVFWTGNAGAVEVSFNGKHVPLPGDANQEGVLVFDSRGVMQHPSAAATQ